MITYTKVPVLYAFNVDPSFKRFFFQLLQVIDFNKVEQSLPQIKLIDTRLRTKPECSKVEFYLLLELNTSSDAQINIITGKFVDSIDKFLNQLFNYLCPTVTFEKKIFF